VTPMDNSGSRKEGVSRTYKGCDGDAPMPAYLMGQEGYCLAFDLREGKQHCLKDTPSLLRRTLHPAQEITDQPLLLRLGGGNDSIENIDVVLERNEIISEWAPVDFLIKWKLRKKSVDEWLDYAKRKRRWESRREGMRVALFSAEHKRLWKGYEYRIRRVMRLTEHTIYKEGQQLLTPEIELEGGSSLTADGEAIIQCYARLGTSEQFHSEFKTDLDIERLPSGKFATNALGAGSKYAGLQHSALYRAERLAGSGFSKAKQSPKAVHQTCH
jgi:hypothetical protein